MSVRDILLIIYGSVWAVVTLINAIANKGKIDPELWVVLGGGIGGLLAVFKVDSGQSNRPVPPTPVEEKHE